MAVSSYTMVCHSNCKIGTFTRHEQIIQDKNIIIPCNYNIITLKLTNKA